MNYRLSDFADSAVMSLRIGQQPWHDLTELFHGDESIRAHHPDNAAQNHLADETVLRIHVPLVHVTHCNAITMRSPDCVS